MYVGNGGARDIDVICVQSTKGGVGKTLLSLLVAQILLEENDKRRVAWIDLDFTGTSVADIKELSKLKREEREDWSVHGIPIGLLSGGKRGLFKEDSPITILNLFEKHLLGSPAAAMFPKLNVPFKTEAGVRRILHIPSGSTYLSDAAGEGATLRENVLFDATHADWFVDFLFEVFEELRDKNPGAQPAERLTIVLDNAPGESAVLSRLQRELSRREGVRPRFLHIASPDEMDLRASLEILSKLSVSAQRILRTRQRIDDFRSAARSDRVKAWGKLLQAVQTGGDIDKDLVLEEINECAVDPPIGVDKHRAPSDPSIFAALIVNKVAGEVALRKIDEYLSELVKTSASKKDTFLDRAMLPRLPRMSLPHDPVLALFFQGRFSAESAGATPPIAEAGAADRDAPAEPTDPALRNVAGMYQADTEVFDALWRDPDRLEELSAGGDISRAVRLNTASHLIRGFDAMARALGLCHHIVAHCRPDLKAPPADEVKAFRLDLIHTLTRIFSNRRNKNANDDPAQFDATALLPSVSRRKFNEVYRRLGETLTPTLSIATIESFQNIARGASEGEISCLNDLLDRVFVLHGCYAAFPDDLEPVAADRSREFKLKSGRTEVYRLILDLSRLLMKSAEKQTATTEICLELETALSADGEAVGGDIQHFHLELSREVLNIRTFARSLEHAAAASRMVIDLSERLKERSFISSDLASLYLRSALEGLFRGVRSDVEGVRREVESILLVERPRGNERLLTREMEEATRDLLRSLLEGAPEQ